MMRLPLVMILTLLCCGAAAPPERTVITANSIFDVPKAAQSHWVAAPGRTTVELTSDQAMLRGWSYQANTAGAPLVLVFGGNGYSIDIVDAPLRTLAAQGATVVEYDYRGFGFSSGAPDMAKIRSDALRLYDKAVDDDGGKPVIVYGYSLGTLFASYVASMRPVRGVVLAAPIATAQETFRSQPDSGAASPVLTDDLVTALDVVSMIAKSHAPLLVIHGTADETIAFAEGKEVFAASPASLKTFVPIKGAGHDGVFFNPKAVSSFRQFLASLPS
jgi:pimeloyl-ACP methyl ester carboxylesterase